MVADIGGTNTRVALSDGAVLRPGTVRRYRNEDFPGLETVLRTYIADEGCGPCDAASVAIAGPVRDGRGTLTNLDWTIDEATLARAAETENVAVLNDLQAQAYAIGHVAPEHLQTVIPGGEPSPEATQLVIGIGTGFNAAPVFRDGDAQIVPASEAGHANLPIRTEEELRLCQFVETAHGFPAVEDVLSGRGLERVYAWRGHEDGDPREARAAEIMAACDQGNDPRAEAAVRVFVRILGTVAGNLSLIHLPFGGIYLVGGVARAAAAHLSAFGFADAFQDKGRFSSFMRNFPVSIITDDYAALTGSAHYMTRQTDR